MFANNEEIEQIIEDFEHAVARIEEDLFRLVWSMRGGVNLDQAYNLSIKQRKAAAKIIKENYNTTKETRLPHF